MDEQVLVYILYVLCKEQTFHVYPFPCTKLWNFARKNKQNKTPHVTDLLYFNEILNLK